MPQVENEKVPAADATRVNSKTSADAVADSDPETLGLVDEESKYYLTGKRLWLVHTGVLLSVYSPRDPLYPLTPILVRSSWLHWINLLYPPPYLSSLLNSRLWNNSHGLFRHTF